MSSTIGMPLLFLWSRYSSQQLHQPKNTGSSMSTTVRSPAMGTTNTRLTPLEVCEIKIVCPPERKLS
jgi:hypothetical protein